MDKSGGRVPGRLDALQKAWKQYKADDWESWLKQTGCSRNYGMSVLQNVDAWLRQCQSQAAAKGSRYQRRNSNNRSNRGYNRGYGRNDNYGRENRNRYPRR